MDFKEALEKDLMNTFFNCDEFSEVVVINGVEMPIVRDDDELKKFKFDKKLGSCEIVFHVKSTYFEYKPQPELLMDFEGKEYRIVQVVDNFGMLTIGLSRNVG